MHVNVKEKNSCNVVDVMKYNMYVVLVVLKEYWSCIS